MNSPICNSSPYPTTSASGTSAVGGRSGPNSFDFKKVAAGLLVQTSDLGVVTEADLKVVTRRVPDAALIDPCS